MCRTTIRSSSTRYRRTYGQAVVISRRPPPTSRPRSEKLAQAVGDRDQARRQPPCRSRIERFDICDDGFEVTNGLVRRDDPPQGQLRPGSVADPRTGQPRAGAPRRQPAANGAVADQPSLGDIGFGARLGFRLGNSVAVDEWGSLLGYPVHPGRVHRSAAQPHPLRIILLADL